MKLSTAGDRPESAVCSLASPRLGPAARAQALPRPGPAACAPGSLQRPGRPADSAGGPAQPAAVPSPQDGRRCRAPVAGIAVIAAAAVGLEMLVSARYGYQRDELYFLAAGHHLAFGYVDQPALTPLLARISSAVFGNSLAGLRVLPALALAALATATCAEYLAAMHLLTTTVPDFVAWAVMFLLVMRLLASENRRWWLAIGACAGIGADAKWNIGFLVVALAAGFILTRARKLLMSRYMLAGVVLAAALAAPDVIWQAVHGWPNLAVFHVLQGAAGHNQATYWPAQLAYTGLALAPVWIAGLVW